MAKTKMETAPDFMAAVAAVAKPKEGKAVKSKHPVVILPVALGKNLIELIKAKEVLARAKAEVETNSAPIIAHVRGVQDADGIQGSFSGSYMVIGGKALPAAGQQGLFVSADKWSVPQDEAIKAELAAVVGAERVKDVIRERYAIKVRDEVMLDKGLQKELMERIGGDFAKFFSAEKVMETVPELNARIYEVAGNEQIKVAKIRELVKQSSPYIK